jgi:nucleotide-binding universal stress UspA family protein
VLRVITIANDDDPTGMARQFQLEVGSSGWRRKNRATAYLAQLEHQLREDGLLVETALVIGDQSEADEIVSYAAEHDCDLIVMANDSRPWYRRWVRPSPVDGVRRKATVPTLFVVGGNRKLSTPRTPPKANQAMEMFGTPSL